MNVLQQSVVFEITNPMCVPEGTSVAQLVRALANTWARENQARVRIISWIPTDSGQPLGFKITIPHEVTNADKQPVAAC